MFEWSLRLISRLLKSHKFRKKRSNCRGQKHQNHSLIRIWSSTSRNQNLKIWTQSKARRKRTSILQDQENVTCRSDKHLLEMKTQWGMKWSSRENVCPFPPQIQKQMRFQWSSLGWLLLEKVWSQSLKQREKLRKRCENSMACTTMWNRLRLCSWQDERLHLPILKN